MLPKGRGEGKGRGGGRGQNPCTIVPWCQNGVDVFTRYQNVRHRFSFRFSPLPGVGEGERGEVDTTQVALASGLALFMGVAKGKVRNGTT